MSDSTVNVVSTTQSSENNTADCSCTSDTPDKLEKVDVNIKEELSTTVETSTVSASPEDNCPCNDAPSVDDKTSINHNNSTNVETDCKPTNISDPIISTTISVGNRNDDKETETKDNSSKSNQVDNKAPKASTEFKSDCDHGNVKEEKTEVSVEHLDNQQTRNLFETVGLVLRSTPSHTAESAGLGSTENQPNKEKPPNISPSDTPEIKEEGAPLYCKFCGFPAPSQNIYLEHMKYHDRKNTTYACFICGIRYKKRDFIISHYVETHELEEANLLKCESCKFVTSDGATFKEHNRKHFLIRPHSCGICYQTFATLYNYQRHMEKHTDVERDGVGYSKPLPKRRRASSLTQGKAENSNSNKRSRQSSKLEEGTKSPFDDSKSVKSKPVNRNLVSQGDPKEPKSEEPTSEAEKVQQKQYFVLPTKRINLVCSFCETVTLSKRELSQHLLSLHGDEIITFKSL
ncbi:hypothetical protein ACHWQZ_G016496 [Mnemiopsis leidyi]